MYTPAFEGQDDGVDTTDTTVPSAPLHVGDSSTQLPSTVTQVPVEKPTVLGTGGGGGGAFFVTDGGV